ncbi:MAG: hypothetical protein ACE5FD_06865 [Anaerolineae bacterium]
MMKRPGAVCQRKLPTGLGSNVPNVINTTKMTAVPAMRTAVYRYHFSIRPKFTRRSRWQLAIDH